ncbi:hypothetical protein [Shivajiella indica]|uniref:Uncharacterized protein n=1 Tax=Shivajiella indica TaxID=872115 RepID=A0ABW5BEH2_9BACT
MANVNNKFDQYFREKLREHEEKPSELVWERLENQLDKKKAGGYPFLKIAATILLLLGLGYIIWNSSDKNEQAPELLSDVIENESQVQEPNESFQNTIKEEKPENEEPKIIEPKEAPKTDIVPKKKSDSKPIKQKISEGPKSLLAKAETEAEREKSKETAIELPNLTLPELNIEEAIASNLEEEESTEDFVEYRIIIKSNGLKDEPKKQTLIEGIENNVNKIGGFLTKVEQGFADLQDAKDNLFASNSTKKERSK